MRAPIFSRGSSTVTFDRFRMRMRVSHPSKGTPKRSRDVWWSHFRWKGPTRANIVQLPVAHARTPSLQGNFFGVTWRLMTSHPVAMLLPVMCNGTCCTTIIIGGENAGTGCACARYHFQSHDFQFRSRDFRWRHFLSGPLPVTSLPVAPPQMRVWLSLYTTSIQVNMWRVAMAYITVKIEMINHIKQEGRIINSWIIVIKHARSFI